MDAMPGTPCLVTGGMNCAAAIGENADAPTAALQDRGRHSLLKIGACAAGRDAEIVQGRERVEETYMPAIHRAVVCEGHHVEAGVTQAGNAVWRGSTGMLALGARLGRDE